MRGFVVPTVRYWTCCHLLQSSWNNWTAGTCRSRSCDQIAFYTRWKLPVYNQWARRDDGSRDRELVLSLCCWFLWTEAADNPVCSLHRSSFQSCKRLLTISRCAKTNMQLSTTSRFFPLIHEQSLPAFAKCTFLHFFTQYFFFLKDRLARRPYQPYLIIGTIPLNSSPIQKLQRANSPF